MIVDDLADRDLDGDIDYSHSDLGDRDQIMHPIRCKIPIGAAVGCGVLFALFLNFTHPVGG
jgi:hypothetical protein